MYVYIWSFSPFLAQDQWNFLSIESHKRVFCYVNEVTFEKHLKMGPGC